MNKWDAKFGFFWYNDDEIFRFTEKDFDEKARRMAESGINIVMTFSCTHFRWSMKEYWPLITKCLKNVVKACHRNGIKVVEHHSAHLTWDPLDQADWDRLDSVMKRRKSSIESWDGFREYIAPEYIKGTESYRQIDGRTGEWARTRYSGWGMCFNNPDYRKEYFDYLGHLYESTEIDGIMTDDIQYFADGHACACKYCKSLFKEQYGYDMPAPGSDWQKFHGDFDNPVYIAWEKFRRASTLDFQESVNKHFESLGLNLLRPNYVSGAITFNWTGYPFEKALHIWDWVFQENCHSFVIKHSWPQFLQDSRHRFNMGRLKDIPSMSMFYPDRYDSFYFSWALSMSWGQLFTATPEGEDMCRVEKVFRDFERKHSNILFEQKKKADVTIYWSFETANYCNYEVCNHITAVKSWSQALTFAGYTVDMVFASEDTIDNNVHSCLIVPDVMMMADSEYEKINAFAQGGGTVIYTGRPGAKKPDGTYRTPEKMQQMLRMPDEPLMKAGPTEFSIGEGRIIIYGQTDLDNDYYEPFSVDRWNDLDLKRELVNYKADSMAEKAKRLISKYVYKLVDVLPGHPLVNTYYAYDKTCSNLIIHILNAAGTIDSDSREEGHAETIPGFKKDSKKEFTADITVNINGLKDAFLVSIETPGEISLETKMAGDKTVIHIPQGIFSGHAILRIPIYKVLE